MVAMVVSRPAATYWWMMWPQLSAGISPRSAAAKMPWPMLPGSSWSMVSCDRHW